MSAPTLKDRLVILLADETFIQLIKFLVIGVFNTLFGYLVYVLLLLLVIPHYNGL